MTAIAEKIMQRVSVHGRGTWVCSPKDFLDFGSRDAVDQALSRLVKTKRLRRVGHGLYDLPRLSKALKKFAPADLDAIIAAIARRDGVRIMPNGLVPANSLGLTNAVPAKPIYVTDGHSRTIKIGERTIQFLHASPSVVRWAGRPGEPVVHALRWLGPRITLNDNDIVSILRRVLPDYVKSDLLDNSRDLPGWALPVVRSITNHMLDTTA